MRNPGEQGSEQWFRHRVGLYKREIKKYDKYAKYLQAVFEQTIRPIAPLAMIQARAKTVPSFAEKIQRKQAVYGDPTYQPTDLCGARIIVQTRSQIAMVCRFIEENFTIDQANSEDKEALLAPEMFGYLSRHYILSIEESSDILRRWSLKSAERIVGLKAEVQVRTMLQHAWAEVQHDSAYKGDFTMPDESRRGLHRLAAMLEEADKDFDRIIDAQRRYRSSYGGYVEPDELRREIGILRTVLRVQRDPEVAYRIGKLYMCLGEWQNAIDTMAPFEGCGSPKLIRDLGISMCKAHGAHPRSEVHREGRRHIERAWDLSGHTDSDAVTALAKAWLCDSPTKARKFYQLAYELDPTDPYTLENYLNNEIARRDLNIVNLVAPTLRESIERCEAQVQVGTNMPWAYLSMGKFYLLLGDFDASLDTYCRGILVATAPWELQTAMDSLDRLSKAEGRVAGIQEIIDLLRLGLATKFQDSQDSRPLSASAEGQAPHAEPVVLAYGVRGADRNASADPTINLVKDTLSDWDGQVLVYLEGTIPKSKTSPSDPAGNKSARHVSVCGVLRQWGSLVSSGVDSRGVKVIGFGGGQAEGAAYKIALTLGAQVALIPGSDGQALSVLDDPFWRDHSQLLPIPADAVMVSAFVAGGLPDPSEAWLPVEAMAREIHLQHREDLIADRSNPKSDDPAWWPWDALDGSEKGRRLQESSRESARDVVRKLRNIGYDVKSRSGTPGVSELPLSQEELEILAEMEHARFVVERLADGWRYGEKKDSENKISPSLVPWTQLDDTNRGWDRSIIQKHLRLLSECGLEIVKPSRRG